MSESMHISVCVSDCHPRAGGDPRINRAGIRHADMSSPRRRGSMGVATTAANTDCVIPAQVGVHASTGQEYATQTCHPRAGGDPWALPPPPPTPIASSSRRRGAMHQPGRNTPRRHVIPAQAGIHGCCRHRRQHRLRHPRTGGGPRINRAGIRHADMSSPRRRGSMGVAATAANTDCVIPAQVGIHGNFPSGFCRGTGFPPARE